MESSPEFPFLSPNELNDPVGSGKDDECYFEKQNSIAFSGVYFVFEHYYDSPCHGDQSDGNQDDFVPQVDGLVMLEKIDPTRKNFRLEEIEDYPDQEKHNKEKYHIHETRIWSDNPHNKPPIFPNIKADYILLFFSVFIKILYFKRK